MVILGIETSCDETGLALYHSERGLLAHALHSQIALHAEYGGVVPELASRDHVRKTLPLLRGLFQQAGVEPRQVNGVAYTRGPGLIGALLVGAAIGRGLAWAWQVPAIGVHHMEGHLLAPMLEPDPPAFPFVALLVSGGHTLLVRVDGIGHYRIHRRVGGRRRRRGLRQDRQAARPALPRRPGAGQAGGTGRSGAFPVSTADDRAGPAATSVSVV